MSYTTHQYCGSAASRRVFLQDVVAEVEVIDQSLNSAAQLRVSATSYFVVAGADSFAQWFQLWCVCQSCSSAHWARSRLTKTLSEENAFLAMKSKNCRKERPFGHRSLKSHRCFFLVVAFQRYLSMCCSFMHITMLHWTTWLVWHRRVAGCVCSSPTRQAVFTSDECLQHCVPVDYLGYPLLPGLCLVHIRRKMTLSNRCGQRRNICCRRALNPFRRPATIARRPCCYC